MKKLVGGRLNKLLSLSDFVHHFQLRKNYGGRRKVLLASVFCLRRILVFIHGSPRGIRFMAIPHHHHHLLKSSMGVVGGWKIGEAVVREG